MYVLIVLRNNNMQINLVITISIQPHFVTDRVNTRANKKQYTIFGSNKYMYICRESEELPDDSDESSTESDDSRQSESTT